MNDEFAFSRDFGQRVKKIREESNMTRAEFAKTLGVSPAYITYIEKGEKAGEPVRPSEPFLFTLAGKFGVDPAWLKTGLSEPRKTKKQRLMGKILSLNDKNLDAVIEFIDSLQ